MATGQNRISNLPDEILLSILRRLPLKSAVAASALSRRWTHLWQHVLVDVPALDFGEDFSTGQPPQGFVANVHRYLRLHGPVSKLQILRILFCPFDRFLPDIGIWIAAAARKSVEELDLDLSQGILNPVDGCYIDGRQSYPLPHRLRDCSRSLRRLSLSRCDFPDSFDFSGFGRLRTLSLSHVNITDDMLRNVLGDCGLLETLILRNCERLSMIEVSGPELRLMELVDCRGAHHLRVFAPKLQSFYYIGYTAFDHIWLDVPKMVDAYVHIVDDHAIEHDYMEFLQHLAHVKVLTICSTVLTDLVTNHYYDGLFPINFDILQELTIVMESTNEEHVNCVCVFFEICPSPSLESLFIQLPLEIEERIDNRDYIFSNIDEPLDVFFSHLKVIKMSNFQGSRKEIAFAKFFLENASNLETLLLVAPPISESDQDFVGPVQEFGYTEERMSLRIIHGQLSVLPKVPSDVGISFCESWEDDGNLNPTHKHMYSEYSYLSGTLCHLMNQALPREDNIVFD